MNIVTYQANGYEVVRVTDDVGVRADLAELCQRVQALLDEGKTRIALAFTPSSHLDSRAIGNLARCVEAVRAHQGSMAVVQPNPEIADFLRVVGFTRHVQICSTEAELGF
jgi:anti-anti-sigma factor